MSNKYTNFSEYLTAIRDIPEVRALLTFGTSGMQPLIERQAAEAIAQTFELWYEARSYAQLGEYSAPGTNAYPGDRAAFNVALKAAFYRIRYAYPRNIVDRALEAIARSIPDSSEIDSYPETQQFVQRLQKRARLVERLKAGVTGKEDCTCPTCTLRRQLKGLVGDGSADESNPENLEAKLREALGQAGADVGQGGELQLPPLKGDESPEQIEKVLRDALMNAIGGRGRRSRPDGSYLRSRLIEQGAEVREKINAGDIDQTVREALGENPTPKRVTDLQVALAVSAQLGFGDIVDPFVQSANRLYPQLAFTPSPSPQDPEFLTFERLKKELTDTINQVA